MEKVRRDLIELIVAVTFKDPKIDDIITDIMGGWNQHMVYQYGEAVRRKKEKEAK